MEEPVSNTDMLEREEVKSEEGDSSLDRIEEISGDGLLLGLLNSQEDSMDENDADEEDEKDNEEEESGDNVRGLEFSLSNLTFAIGGALHASTANLGSATAHLRASLKLSASSSEDPNASSQSLPAKWSDHHFSQQQQQQQQRQQQSSPVNFGSFEDRASRLRYNQQDIYDIADNPVQFDELQEALRSMGAVTNGILKQKLHWYIKNSRRERALKEKEQQQQQEQEQQQSGSITPPNAESNLMDSSKLRIKLQLETDQSPTSVRELFVAPN